MDSTTPMKFRYSKCYLFAAHVALCLEDQVWIFCTALSMGVLGGMQAVSIEHLFKSFLQMLFNGVLGNFLDSLTRKQAIVTVALFNNLILFLASILIFACLSVDPSSSLFLACLISSIVVYATHRVFLNAEKYLIRNDWVVLLSNKSTLSGLNASLSAIDQFTSVITPIFTGFIVTCFGLRMAVAIFGFGSLLSLGSKAFFLNRIYVSNESLWYKKDEDNDNDSLSSTTSNRGAIRTFYEQSTFLAALGMALICKTVMSFDGLAVGYAASVGLQYLIIGILRSYGSLMGMLGSFSYAFFEKKYNAATSGMIGLVTQQIFVSIAVISIWLRGSPMDLTGYFGNLTFEKWWNDIENSFNGNFKTNRTSHSEFGSSETTEYLDSVLVLLIAISTARYGLCCIALAITHIMQVNTSERERNTVFGMEHSLIQAFSVSREILVMIFPQNATFCLYILTSFGFVTTGQFCFIYYLMKSNTFSIVGKRKSSKAEEIEYAVG